MAKAPPPPIPQSPASGPAKLDFARVIKAHQDWKKRLRLATNRPAEAARLDPSAIARDDQCALGEWIHGAGQLCCGSTSEYDPLKKKHAEFHRCAGEVADFARKGDVAAAKQLLYGRFSELSEQTVALIKLMRVHAEGGTAKALAAPKSDADGDWEEF